MAGTPNWETMRPGDQDRYIDLATMITTRGMAEPELSQKGFRLRFGHTFEEVSVIAELARVQCLAGDPLENLEAFARELTSAVHFKEA